MIADRDGRPVVVVEPTPRLAALLEQWRFQMLHRGRRVDPVVDELVDDVLRAVRRLQLLSVSASGQSATGDAPELARSESMKLVMTSTAAAQALGVSTRTVRRRCVTGRYPGARVVGRDWHIPLEDLEVNP